MSRKARRFGGGPTGLGKTAVAFALARIAPVELISMDAMLVYRDLAIVTAKPGPAERAEHPIHAIDLVASSESFSVASYLEEAERAELEIEARGRVPVFVGGTGLYLKALTHGLFEGPPPDPELRRSLTERAEREGDEALYAELQRVDPSAAAKIHPRDRKRVVRALEVFVKTGERISELQREWTLAGHFPRILVGLRVPKEALARRIAARVDAMLVAGGAEEVRAASAKGFSREAREAVGVKEIAEWNAGAIDRATCRERMIQRTRLLARRQATWLRSFEEIRWVDAGDALALARVAAEVKRVLEL